MSVAKLLGPVVSASMAVMASQAMARVATDDLRQVTSDHVGGAVEAEARSAMTRPTYRAAMSEVVDAIARSYGDGDGRLSDHLLELATNACPQGVYPCDQDATNSSVYQGYNPDAYNGPSQIPKANGGPYVGDQTSTAYCYSNCYSACYGDCYSN